MKTTTPLHDPSADTPLEPGQAVNSNRYNALVRSYAVLHGQHTALLLWKDDMLAHLARLHRAK